MGLVLLETFSPSFTRKYVRYDDVCRVMICESKRGNLPRVVANCERRLAVPPHMNSNLSGGSVSLLLLITVTSRILLKTAQN